MIDNDERLCSWHNEQGSPCMRRSHHTGEHIPQSEWGDAASRKNVQPDYTAPARQDQTHTY